MTMSTQFRQRKFAKVFDLYDVNKDGYIDAADYARVGQGLGTATGSAPGSAGYEKMRSDYLEYWDQLRLGADTDHDGRVSQAEFVAHYETLPAIKETILAVVQGILRLTDRDGDGKISQAEFAAAQQETSQSLDIAEKNLAATRGKTLNAAQSDLVSKIKGFLKDAREAMRAGDWALARNLAKKAQVLSEELLHSV